MKKTIYLIYVLIGLSFLTACEKEDGPRLSSSDLFTSPQITSPVAAASFILLKDNETDTITFNWSKADYGVELAVQYVLQADITGNSFASPTSILTATADSAIIEVSTLNEILLSMGLTIDAANDVDFRLMSYVPEGTINGDSIYSETITLSLTPYATTFPPIYMCGAGVGGWSWDKSQEMRSTDPYQYSTIAYFYANEAFRFFAQRDWNPTSYNYPYFSGGTISELFENALDGDSNFKFIGTSGFYLITVNTQTKVITMAAAEDQTMFMTGAGVGNGDWSWDTNAVEMTWISNGVYETTTTFNNDGAFRFFKTAGWGTSYNYPYFESGTISDLFENALDGDSNFRFIGTTGSFTITLNMLDNIITMEAVAK